MNGITIPIRAGKRQRRFPRCAVLLVMLGALVFPARLARASVGNEDARVVRVQSSPQLFATMCALHAAGYEINAGSAEFYPWRAGLLDKLVAMQGPAVDALRDFYGAHLLATPTETLSRYVSFALVVGPPPNFAYLYSREELPPDVLTLEGFGEVLANFYREQHLEQLWAQVAPQYEAEARRLRGPVAQAVTMTAAYLREVLPTTSRRSFAVYIEPLIGSTANSRSYGEQCAVVVSPGPDFSLDPIRHAFLHFLLDPLALRYSSVVASKSSLLELAARAPQLPRQYREDFSSLLTECLVRAVELRLRKLPPARLDAALDQADRDGYVLVRPLARQFENFDQAEPSMNRFFPELIGGIDLAQETRRLQQIKFAAGGPATGEPANMTEASTQGGSELEHLLEAGNRQIAAQDAVGAAGTFERILEKYPKTPRAVYGLAVASILQGRAERAKELFKRLLANASPQAGRETSASSTDPVILAWAHVYLGRIGDVQGNRELALSEYRAVLAVEGAPESARLAARQGIEKSYKVPVKSRETGQQEP